jgi:dTDP-4-amino-4,6-dideoxygalactose transaminase
MLLTYSPLPKFRHFKLMFAKPLSDMKLSQPWCGAKDIFRWYSCSAHSLFAITAIKSRNDGAKKTVIWLPDFFCNSSLEPVRKLNIQIVFYPVDSQFKPDFDWCNENQNFDKPDIFLLVHYFGIPVKSKDARIFCTNNNAWLVEDAAHCLLPIKGVGDNADFVLYSPHKQMAIMDGAILVIKESGQQRLAEAGIQESEMIFGTHGSTYRNKAGNRFIIIWVLKRILQVLGLRKKNKSYVFWPDVDITGASFGHREMSKISKVFLMNQLNELKEYANLRKRHYSLWKDQLLTKDIKKSEKLSDDIIPYFATFDLNNGRDISNIYRRLKQAGVPVTTWPDLPPEVVSDEDKHKNALHLRKSRFYVHVHQSLNPKEITKLCQELA